MVVWYALVDVVPVLHPVLGLLLLPLMLLGALVDGDRGQGGPLVVPEGDVPLEGQEGWLWQEVPESKKRWLAVNLYSKCVYFVSLLGTNIYNLGDCVMKEFHTGDRGCKNFEMLLRLLKE